MRLLIRRLVQFAATAVCTATLAPAAGAESAVIATRPAADAETGDLVFFVGAINDAGRSLKAVKPGNGRRRPAGGSSGRDAVAGRLGHRCRGGQPGVATAAGGGSGVPVGRRRARECARRHSGVLPAGAVANAGVSNLVRSNAPGSRALDGCGRRPSGRHLAHRGVPAQPAGRDTPGPARSGRRQRLSQVGPAGHGRARLRRSEGRRAG